LDRQARARIAGATRECGAWRGGSSRQATPEDSGTRGTWRLAARVPAKRSESMVRLATRVLRQAIL